MVGNPDSSAIAALRVDTHFKPQGNWAASAERSSAHTSGSGRAFNNSPTLNTGVMYG